MTDHHRPDGSWPRTTGQVALQVDLRESQVADIVRRGHVRPPPPVVFGRRRWYAEHVRALENYVAHVRQQRAAAAPAPSAPAEDQ